MQEESAALRGRVSSLEEAAARERAAAEASGCALFQCFTVLSLAVFPSSPKFPLFPLSRALFRLKSPPQLAPVPTPPTHALPTLPTPRSAESERLRALLTEWEVRTATADESARGLRSQLDTAEEALQLAQAEAARLAEANSQLAESEAALAKGNEELARAAAEARAEAAEIKKRERAFARGEEQKMHLELKVRALCYFVVFAVLCSFYCACRNVLACCGSECRPPALSSRQQQKKQLV